MRPAPPAARAPAWLSADAAAPAVLRRCSPSGPASSAGLRPRALVALAAAPLAVLGLRAPRRRRAACCLGQARAPARAGAARLVLAATAVDVVDAAPAGAAVATTVNQGQGDATGLAGLGMVPPPDCRSRLRHTRGMLGKGILAYIGDTVWEYCVLKHQYAQVARSPFTESQASRNLKQAKAAGLLFRGSVLTDEEKEVLEWATSNAWRRKVRQNAVSVVQVGYEQYSGALGLRALLGYLYIDEKGDDARLDAVAREVGLLSEPGEEDELLAQVTGGRWDPRTREPGTYFLALAPLGHCALRLYICRYLCQRPPRDDEFIYRVKLALREEELDLASVGFMRDDATAEEVQLMKAARDQEDTYAFAFECLLGHLALSKPYRMQQILAGFGWAPQLPGT